MPKTGHPTRVWDCFMSEDEKRDRIIFQLSQSSIKVI